MIVHCAKSTCFVRSVFACVRVVYYKTEESGMENEHSSSWNPLHWEKRRIKHTQIKEKQFNLIL